MNHRVVALFGKGGVGRTTVAAALARTAVARGHRTLLMETDPRAPIAAAYGRPPSFKPCLLADGFFTMLLDRQQSLEEYLGFVVAWPLLRAVFASSLYQYFVHAAPALRELMMMGKIFHEVERRAPTLPRWDLIVVDLPASGQALGMIAMPYAARETFGSNLVGREAETVGRFFRNRAKCATAIVTAVDQLAITETLDIYRRLDDLELAPTAIIFNRMSSASFDAADVARLFEPARPLPDRDVLAALAQADLKRRVRERRALGLLKRSLGVPIIQLSEFRGCDGVGLTASLAEQLAGVS